MRDTVTKNKDWKVWGKGKFCCDIKGPGPSKRSHINLNMGIIDILQKYNTGKLMESLFKSKQHFSHRSESEVSAVNSGAYKERFDDFMDEIIMNKSSSKSKKRKSKRKSKRKKTRKLRK